MAINFDYRKIVVLVFLMCAMYLLILPHKHWWKGKEKDGKSSNPGRKTISDDGGKPTIDVVSEEEFPTKPKLDDISSIKAKLAQLYKMDNIREKAMDALKKKVERNKEISGKKEKEIVELKKEIKNISLKANETEHAYINLIAEVEKNKTIEKENNKSTHVVPVVTKPTDALELKTNKLIPFKGLKLVHFDLKGAPPKIDYLIAVMNKSKDFGANGFLIEYEDMFPWSGELEMLAHKNAYTKENIQLILKTAEDLKMEIVPLVQTFGHLEFVLKHKEFSKLRAVAKVTTSICPLNEKSLPLIKKLLDQMIASHPNSKWIHLGGDEVWNIKNCDACTSGKDTDADLFLRHMIPIMKYTKTKSMLPVIWDDMMRYWNVKDLKKMAQHVTPMVWAYVADLKTYHKFPEGMWDRYMEAFPKIWFASSFKGALKPWSNVVPIKQHLDNHLSWLKIYKKYQENKKDVIGIALTGWSRFDHYGPLCELLPAGIPSLALCLAVLNQGSFDEDLHKKTSKLLGFKKDFTIKITNFKKYIPETATFPGNEVFTLAGALENAVGWEDDWSEVRLVGWLRPYLVHIKHVSFYQMKTILHDFNTNSKMLKKVEKGAKEKLDLYFDDYVVEEWLEDKIQYSQNLAGKTIIRVKKLIKEF